MKLVRVVSIAALGLSVCGATAFAAPQNVNRRQAHQQHRIAEGIRNGTLTPRETAQLERQEARIAALEKKDRESHGGLSPKERAELNRLLSRESHRIYKEKHDGQGR
jgi:Spy/CpxP family protein refolding chaperone